jgi:hypothetical protein
MLSPGAERDMPDYQAQVMNADGQWFDVIELDCADDLAALKAADRLLDQNYIESWQDERKLGTLHPLRKPIAKLAPREMKPSNVVPFQRPELDTPCVDK